MTHGTAPACDGVAVAVGGTVAVVVGGRVGVAVGVAVGGAVVAGAGRVTAGVVMTGDGG